MRQNSKTHAKSREILIFYVSLIYCRHYISMSSIICFGAMHKIRLFIYSFIQYRGQHLMERGGEL
jgi:hypothetical protein